MNRPQQENGLPIVFDGVTVSAGGVDLLAGISLSIGAGAPTVVVGPNGAGKTTLLRAAMGLISVNAGTLTWAGAAAIPVEGYAYMFQRPVMLWRTASDNVRYALKSGAGTGVRRDERVVALLERVGLAHVAHRPARRLSGGEQQRVVLARALAQDPCVLLLDEPTASADPAGTQCIEDAIRAAVASGVKVVMATHDLGQARRLAGDMLLLDRGHLIEAAPAHDFFTSPREEKTRRFLAGELLA